jgi:hypothetical protein
LPRWPGGVQLATRPRSDPHRRQAFAAPSELRMVSRQDAATLLTELVRR